MANSSAKNYGQGLGPGSITSKRKNSNDSDTADNSAHSKKAHFDSSRGGNSTHRKRNGAGADETPTPLWDYSASGIKRSLHGTIYQLKLLMLFFKRGTAKEYNFRLATEMDAAEKFDDVVFKYKQPNDVKWTYIFLQAKHKQHPEDKKITVTNLTTTTDGDFSLQKYFISFCKIKRNRRFQGDDLNDFTISTNTDFVFDQNDAKSAKSEWKEYFTETNLDHDDILYFKGKGKERRLKDNDNTLTAITKEIKSGLLKTSLELKEIKKANTNLNDSKEALELKVKYNKIEEAKKNLDRNLLIEMAQQILKLDNDSDLKGAKEKVEKAKKSKEIDRKTLINEIERVFKNLSSKKNDLALKEIEKVYEEIGVNLKRAKENISKSNTLEEIKVNINEEYLKERVPKKFLDDIKNRSPSELEDVKETLEDRLNKAIAEIESEKVVLEVSLDDNKLKEEIEDFIKKLRFVTNCPSEMELATLIKNELGEDFHLLNADLVSHSFEKEMLDWLKQEGGRFLSEKDGNNFLGSIKKKITTLMISGLNRAYPEKLRGYGISFTKRLEALEDFLSSEKRQIFHVSTQTTRLSAIKLLRSLEDFDKYKFHDSFIFMRLKTLLRQETQKYTKDAFSSENSHDLLVIECQAKSKDQRKVDNLYSRLLDILEKDEKKKIMLITLNKDVSVAKFKINEDNKVNDETSFEDLDESSQKKMLEKKVDCQGKAINLNRLIDTNLAGRIIDQTSLLRLVEEDTIVIGDQKAFFSIGYMNDYYIERKLHRQRIKSEVFKKEMGSCLFFITGDDTETLIDLDDKREHIHKWDDRETYNKGIILPAVGQNVQDIFQKLGKNVHWLEYQEGHLFWRASKGNLSVLKNYIEQNYIHDEKISLLEEELSKPKTLGQKVIIIANDAGMGKSTVLTSIARKLKGLGDNKKYDSDDLWTVRLDLNDFAFNKEKLQENDSRRNHKSLKEISFNDDNINAAIDFVSKMAIFGDPNDAHIHFEQELFKASLDKIAILFDGFDEISPTYKERTHVLLKALKESKVAQLWVTTRVHEKAELEENLEAPAYILNHFTEDEQIEFLNKFWRFSLKQKIQIIYKKIFESKQKNEESQKETILQCLKQLKQEVDALPDSLSGTSIQDLKVGISKTLQNYLNQEEQPIDQLNSLQKAIDDKDEYGKYKLDFYDYAATLIKQWKASIKDTEKAFTNVPLNLRMLAEVIFENKFDKPKNLGLLDLYDEFVKIKLDIYKEEKAKAIQGNQAADIVYLVYSEKLSKIHNELALEEIFKEEESSLRDEDNTIKYILSGRRKMAKFEYLLEINKKHAKTEIQRAGLMNFLSDGSPRFIHRSFAEYFLSEYLIKNLENEQVQKVLVEKILVKEGYALIRKFFNAQLEKNPVPNIEFTDTVKKSINESVNGKLDRNDTGQPQKTALHVAAKEGLTGIVKLLLDKLKSNDKNELLKRIVLATDEDDQNALCLAAYNGCNEIVVTLLAFVRDNLTEFLIDLVLVTKGGQNSISAAAEGGHHETFRALLNWLKENRMKTTLKEILLTKDKFGATVLHSLASTGNNETIAVYLETLKDHADILKEMVLTTNDVKQTAFQLAAWSGYHETVTAFLKGLQDHVDILKEMVLATDRNKRTSLYNAAENDNHETINALLVGLKDHPDILENIMLGKGGEQTVLTRTAWRGSFGTVQCLLDAVKDNIHILKAMVIATDGGKQTALHRAVNQGHSEVVKALLNFVRDNLDTVFPGSLKTLLLATDDEENTALHLAAFYKHNETVKSLLDWVKEHLKTTIPFDTTLQELLLATNETGQTALHLAIMQKSTEHLAALLDWVKEHLKSECSLETTLQEMLLATDNNKHNALHLAALSGNHENVMALLSTVRDNLGEDILKTMLLATDNDQQTPVHLADLRRYYEIVATLVGILPAIREDGKLNLRLALLGRNNEIVKTLLNFGRDNLEENILKTMLLETDNDDKQNFLHLAALSGNNEIVTTLFDFVQDKLGEDSFEVMLLTTDKNGQTALHLAAKYGTVSALLAWVKDKLEGRLPGTLQKLLFAKDNQENTALHLAACSDNTIILEILLDFVKKHIDGALKEMLLTTCKTGQTALHVAVWNNGGFLTLLDFLRDHLEQNHPSTLKDLVLATDKYGNNVMHLAAELGWDEVIKTLLSWVIAHIPHFLKEMVLSTNRDGDTALRLLIIEDNIESMTILLEAIKDHPVILKEMVLTVNKNGKPDLYWAVIRKKSETLKTLLDGVRDRPDILNEIVLLTDKDGSTVLNWATQRGQVETLQVLFETFKHHFDTFKKLLLRTHKGGETSLNLSKDYSINWFLRKQYNKIAASLLKLETQIFSFTDKELEILKMYVESNDYIAEVNRDECLNIITKELASRPLLSEGRSFEGFITKGPEKET